MIKTGNRGIQYQIDCCAKTISVKFNEPEHNNTQIKIKPIETS